MNKKISGKEAYKLLTEGRQVYTTSLTSTPWCYKFVDGLLMFSKDGMETMGYSLLTKEDVEKMDDWFIEEYYMTINDVFHKDNLYKYYKTEFIDVTYRLMENSETDGLRLIITRDNEGCYNIGDDIQNIMYLDDILNLKFKEVSEEHI